MRTVHYRCSAPDLPSSTAACGSRWFRTYLGFRRQLSFYDETLRLDLRETPLPFRDQVFHVATCIETVKHLPKDACKALPDEFERIASCVIVTPPGIWFEQDSYHGNILGRHLSLWRASEFRGKGYQV